MTVTRLRAGASLLAFLLAGSGLEAQGSQVNLEFSFSSPGARSLGLGGAFVALADDATAAYANPAGLVQLVRPEVSIEGRSWSYTTPFTVGGRISGEPTGLGLDTTSGVRFDDFSDDLTDLSFLSFVYPRGDWCFALYRHLSANFEANSETRGFFQAQPPPMGGTVRLPDFRSTFDLELINTGIVAAYRFGDTVSVGLGISYIEGRLQSRSEQYVPIDSSLPDGPFGRNGFKPEALFAISLLDVHDSDVQMSLGVLWRPAPRWSVGTFFRSGPRFDMLVTNIAGPALILLPPGTRVARTTPIGFPDVYGAGVAFKSKNERATVSFEWDRIEYSDILDRLEPDPTDFLRLDDGDELHVGFEYAFLHSRPVVAFRTGAWLDPDHRIQGIGVDPLSDFSFQPGDDEVHFALGLGVAFERVQVDLGVDFSDPVDTASLSAIYTF